MAARFVLCSLNGPPLTLWSCHWLYVFPLLESFVSYFDFYWEEGLLVYLACLFCDLNTLLFFILYYECWAAVYVRFVIIFSRNFISCFLLWLFVTCVSASCFPFIFNHFEYSCLMWMFDICPSCFFSIACLCNCNYTSFD